MEILRVKGMSRRRKLAIVATLSTVAFVLICLVLEGGARVLGFHSRSVRRHSWLRQQDPVIGWVYAPDSTFQFSTTRGVIRGSTDREGFRPLVGSATDSDSPVVLCVGDSFTFGAESPDDRTWPECLSRTLAARGRPCRALNRGVTGYGPLQILLGLRRTLAHDPRASKIRAVVYLYSFNDPLENFESDRPHFEPADRAETLAAFKAGTPRVLPPARYRPDRVRSVVRWIRDSSAFLNAIQPERADLSEEAFWNGARGCSAYFSPMIAEVLSKEALREGMRFALRELKKECDARALPLLVAPCVVPVFEGPIARRELESPAGKPVADYQASHQWVRMLIEESGATYVDLRGCLSGLTYREAVASSADWHLSVDSNDRIGRALADQLLPHLSPASK